MSSSPRLTTDSRKQALLQAIERIEKEERTIQEDIRRKRVDRDTLQAVHDSLQKKESEKQPQYGNKKWKME